MKIENLYYERENSVIDEKKWNKEKWRHENPMDYFKAVYLMQSMGKQVQEEMRQYTWNILFLSKFIKLQGCIFQIHYINFIL